MGVVQHIFNTLSHWLWLVICVFLIQPGWASYNSVQKYEYLGNYSYEFVVPASVNEIHVTAKGAKGGGSSGGNGGTVSATLTVTPGETLTIKVGETGSRSLMPTSMNGSYNGGGIGGGYRNVSYQYRSDRSVYNYYYISAGYGGGWPN